MNKVELIGELVKKRDLITVQKSNLSLSFTVKTKEPKGYKFHNLMAWNEVARYIDKMMDTESSFYVYIVGHLSYKQHPGNRRDTFIVVDKIFPIFDEINARNMEDNLNDLSIKHTDEFISNLKDNRTKINVVNDNPAISTKQQNKNIDDFNAKKIEELVKWETEE